jgi:FlaA1/EpsC-like NDP-sugar epimerase
VETGKFETLAAIYQIEETGRETFALSKPRRRFPMYEKINRYVSIAVTIFAVMLSAVSLYTAFFGIFETIIQRTFHLTMVFIISLFIYRLKIAKRHPWIDLTINVFLAVLFALANI